MDDKKLLELAAKASGVNAVFVDTHYEKMFKVPYTEPNVCGWREWNPLTDDGDAMRLAVKLRFAINIGDGGMCSAEGDRFFCSEPIENDIYAATRRAIVRAAAEIGKDKG